MHSKRNAWVHLLLATALVLADTYGTAFAQGRRATTPSAARRGRSAPAVGAERNHGRRPHSVRVASRRNGPVVVSSDDACPIVLERNGTLELHLGGNPSTGYQWDVVEGATNVLASSGAPTQEGESMPGAPAEYVFRFGAVAAGAGHLALVYHRPWETGTSPQGRFDCDIRVR